MSKKKRKRKEKKADFGARTFHCKPCDEHFEIEWETIWAIQEVTHGYVGFHTNGTFISCPVCEQIVEEDDFGLN
jgi:transcription elongation factor Elf1